MRVVVDRGFIIVRFGFAPATSFELDFELGLHLRVQLSSRGRRCRRTIALRLQPRRRRRMPVKMCAPALPVSGSGSSPGWAKVGQLGSAKATTPEPRLAFAGRILLRLYVVGGALSRCMPWSAPLATHSRSSGGAERSAACGFFELPRDRPDRRRRRLLLRRRHPARYQAQRGEQAGGGQPPRRVPAAVAAGAPGLPPT
eukprot:scaffold22235_cov63-Phaeocystis_antarctica.AAC.5